MKNSDVAFVIERFFFTAVDPRHCAYEHAVWNEDGTQSTKTDYVPAFIVEVDWHCNRQHIYSKWVGATGYRNSSGEWVNRDSDSFLIRFYAELDGTNRQRFADWLFKEMSKRTNPYEK